MSVTFPESFINQYINRMYNRNDTLTQTYATNTSFTGIPSYDPGIASASDFGVAANAQGSQSAAFGTYSMASMTNSTAVGFRARAEQTNATAVGEEALVRAFGGTAIGRIANVLGIRGTAIGNAAYIAAGATNGIAIGASARSYSANSVTIGYLTSSGTGTGNVLIGQGSSIADGLNNCTVVGQGTTVTVGSNQTAVGQGITASNSNVTVVGHGSSGTGADETVVGQGNVISGARSSCLGVGNTITHADVIVFGNGIVTTATGQIVFGSATSNFTNMYVGRGITHTGAGQNIQINATGGSGADVAGDSLLIIGGIGTGAGAGGDVLFYTAPAGASSSTPQTPAARLKIVQRGDIIVGDGAIATNATAGFFVLESTAGTPTGVPTGGAGAMVYDSTNNLLYVYGTSWQKVGGGALRGTGRSTAQTAAVATVATYTVGAADASFTVSTNVNVTTSTLHSFSVTVAYTDETNTGRTLTLPVAQLAGTLVTAITNGTGAGPYEGIPLHIRCKASTAITVATSGVFTTLVYNVEARISEI